MLVNIIKVITPVLYEATADPTADFEVCGQYNFVKLDHDINEYYGTHRIEGDPADITKAGQIVIVRHDKDRRFYRARVESILQRSNSYNLLLYLVDTAERLTSALKAVFPIHENFLNYPFLAMNLELSGIKPVKLGLDSELKAHYVEADVWNISAFEYVKNMLRRQSLTKFITHRDKIDGTRIGKLLIYIGDIEVCINDKLVEENFGMLVETLSTTDTNESNDELPIGASATTFAARVKECVPKAKETQKKHTSKLKEWCAMQKELAKTMAEEGIAASPLQNSTTRPKDKRTAPKRTDPTPNQDQSAKSAKPASTHCSQTKPEMKMSEIPLPKSEPAVRKLSFSSHESGSRSVSRGTQYETPEEVQPKLSEKSESLETSQKTVKRDSTPEPDNLRPISRQSAAVNKYRNFLKKRLSPQTDSKSDSDFHHEAPMPKLSNVNVPSPDTVVPPVSQTASAPSDIPPKISQQKLAHSERISEKLSETVPSTSNSKDLDFTLAKQGTSELPRHSLSKRLSPMIPISPITNADSTIPQSPAPAEPTTNPQISLRKLSPKEGSCENLPENTRSSSIPKDQDSTNAKQRTSEMPRYPLLKKFVRSPKFPTSPVTDDVPTIPKGTPAPTELSPVEPTITVPTPRPEISSAKPPETVNQDKSASEMPRKSFLKVLSSKDTTSLTTSDAQETLKVTSALTDHKIPMAELDIDKNAAAGSEKSTQIVSASTDPEMPGLEKIQAFETKPVEITPKAATVAPNAPESQSVPRTVPFGRGFPLKGLSNPFSYIKPGFQAAAKAPAPALTTATIRASAAAPKASESKGNAPVHPSTSIPATHCSTNMDDSLGMSEKASYRKILICGRMPPRPVVDRPHSFAIIDESLQRLRIEQPSVIQSYAWPAIMRGRNLAAISGPRSGKTMTYLPALLAKLYDRALYSNIPQGNGPLALVICSSWRSATQVYDQCQSITQFSTTVRCLLVHGGGYDEDQKVQLINGCDILIVTPCALVRLLTCEEHKSTNLNRLCHFVLEDADVLTEEFTEQINKILSEYAAVQKKLKKQGQTAIPYQILAFSTKWTKSLESFYNNIMPNPLLYCALFQESVVYAGIKVVAHAFPEKEKPNRIIDLLKEELACNNVKTVISTASVDEAEGLYKILNFLSTHVYIAHEDLTMSQVKAVSQCWHGEHEANHFPILIATDACLEELNIEDATCLIHYDIPEMSKSQFGFRFSCLLKYMRKTSAKSESNPECFSHVITTEKCVLQAHSLILMLKRFSSVVPPALQSLALGYYQGREEQKQPIPLCYYLKAFGRCPKQFWCSDRHMLLRDVDKPSENLPRGGLVRIFVTDVRDASRYYGRIIKYQNREGMWEDGNQTIIMLLLDINSHFAKQANCVPHGLPNKGDLCAILGKDASYYRVRVMTRPLAAASGTVREIQILFIDTGSISTAKVSDLLRLPAKLQSIPPQAIEIYLTNVKPVDKDLEFTAKAFRMVQDILTNQEILGKVALSLGTTLWLNSAIKQTKLICSNDYVYDFNLRKELASKYAVDNPLHIAFLEQFCRGVFELATPINIPITSKVKPVPVISEEPNYAFLPLDEVELVEISSLITPSQFYVQKTFSNDCLEQLMDDLKNHFQAKTEKSVQGICVGMVCVARFPLDNELYRGKVMEIIREVPDNPEENDVRVFYVDYGDIHTIKGRDLYPLPDKLLWKLPLQAIECSLANVAPVGKDGWMENNSNFMWALSLDNENFKKELCIKAVRKASISILTKCRYEVELFDPSDGVNDVSFADLMCEGNQATWAPFVESEKNEAQQYEDVLIEELNEVPVLQNGLEKENEPELENGFAHENGSSFEPPSEPSEPESEPCEEPKGLEIQDYHSIANPVVRWWDTKSVVNLEIRVSDVKDHAINLQTSNFFYTTVVKGVLYKVDIELFDEVDNEKFDSRILDNCVKIVLRKNKQQRWKRLIKSNIKFQWLVFDWDRMVLDSDDEELQESETFEWIHEAPEKPKKIDGKKFCPIDIAEACSRGWESSSDDESDSDSSSCNYNADPHAIF